ncbi:RHS repeat-associated protein [Chitinophaga niastensis]|uniref:RHS repeat-associated protein n=1 Tax=Chitinophaga niastensis TaxID=536980 RepID=A0A2P8HDQ3_CHINA|nr:RHS repeat-associated core domain-containing protein [Chitinophaga niastensis]PSL44354.1 RHS repeat-associated protein [Chitinophaga niastensis]
MLVSNKHFIPVIGLDIHIVILFGFPIPLPHPYIGLVIDPMDWIPFIGATTKINHVPRGKSDTNGKLVFLFHIPMGGPFLLAPMIGHDSVNFFGSKKVKVEGNLMSPSGHMLMTCNDIGIPLSLTPGKKFIPIPSLYLPTSYSIPLSFGKPVMVGGPFVPDWAGVIMNLIMSYGFGAALKGLGKLGKKVLTKFNHALKGKLGSNKLSKALCKKGFEPVDLVQGIVIYDGIDFELPGPIPLKWMRSWNSDSPFKGLLGHGNHGCYDMRVQEFPAENATVVLLGDGRSAVFDALPYNGNSEYNRHEKLLLTRSHADEYALFDYESRLTYTFRLSHPRDEQYRLINITDEAGFMISFHYNANGHLLRIIDSAGRHLLILNDEGGRIIQVTAQHRGEQRLLVRYTYNETGDLTGITDALDQTTFIQYRDHLMIKKTDRNGQSFYWEYDQKKRCTHTYGDGGLMEGTLEYHPKEGFNRITNSQGHSTTLYYTPDFVVTQIKAPLGNSIFFAYTADMEIYRVIDAEGNVTGYTYDELGNRTSVVFPDGSATSATYNREGKLVLSADPEGNSRTYIYYEKTGLLHTLTEADGRIRIFRYNDNNLVRKIEDETENHTLLAYDEDFNLNSITLPDGGKTTWEYNTWGQCLRLRNPLREEQTFQYDTLGRVTDIRLPDNHIKLRYNAYKEIVAAQDKQHVVQFAYTPMGNIKLREEKGIKTHFLYNNEEELTGLVNEHGEMYRLMRNANGDIISETGFDGITRRYDRDSAGKVIKVHRPGNKWTNYEYNYNGLLARTEHSDGTWEAFSYNRNGKLLEVATPDNTVKFVRDAMGRMISESQNGHIVTSRYDNEGRRTTVQSSLGANIQTRWNAMDDLTGISAMANGTIDPWTAEIQRNLLGLEIERTLPGGVKSSWTYHPGSSASNTPDAHTVTSGSKITRSHQYHWDANMRLKQIVKGLSEGIVKFGHDDIGNLAWAQYENGQYDYRLPDKAGNLYKTQTRTDRKYAAGGRLLESDQARFIYDEEGNLIKKIITNAALPVTWEYEWYGNGLLKQVRRPDQKTITFQYDGLGRRTQKTFSGQVTRFVWDGHKPLHEWTYPEKEQPQTIIDEYGEISSSHREPVPAETLTTWVFEEKTFKLAAKITDQQQYSVITDHLGTPCEAYDTTGQKLWSAELDIDGNVRKLEGSKDFVPFRYQGQYEDVETGLHYNRFRYYSPQEGMYISQDPIGVAGGWNNYAYVKDTNCYIDIWGWEDIWFRALHPNDMTSLDAGNGIIPKAPGATETPMSHVLNGSTPGYGDQYVSLTKDRSFAERWARKAGTEVGEIDLDKLNNTKLDLSTTEGRLEHLGDVSRAPVGSDLHKANKYAKGAKELLVEGTMANEAVVHRYNPPCL